MAEVIDIDLGWGKICQNFRAINGKTIKAGVLETAGNEKNGASVAEVATYNEYGTSRIPSRPFIAIATDEHKGWQSEVKVRMFDVMSPEGSISDSLDAVGRQMKTDIKNVIGDRGKLAPNAPSTVARKGHNYPLIDTGTLLDSIDYEVK